MAGNGAGSGLAVINDYMTKETMIQRFASVLGPDHRANAFIGSVLITVASNKALQECSPKSIMMAAMRAATLRLSCDPATRQAWLIPYNNKETGTKEAMLVIGYMGYYHMAVRTGMYRYINVEPIGVSQKISKDHMTGMYKVDGDKAWDEEVKGYMFYMRLHNGYEAALYMEADEIHAHAKQYSKSYYNSRGGWQTNPAEMMEKTVLRQGLTKHGYLSPSDKNALSVGDYMEEQPDVVDGEIVQDAAPQQVPAETSAYNTAEDKYRDIAARSDITTAYWILVSDLGCDQEDGLAVISECGGEFKDAFEKMLKKL